MRSSIKLFFLSLLLLLTGCAEFNCTPLERLLGDDVNLLRFGNQIAKDLTESAMPPLFPMHPELPVLTTTFVNLDDLTETSRFGRLIQAHIGTSLVNQRYSVKEITLRHTMDIQPGEGETILSRDLKKINQEQLAQAILIGTYSLNNRILYITTKLVDPKSRNIISAQSYKLCMDDNLLALFGLRRVQTELYDPVDPARGSFIDWLFY